MKPVFFILSLAACSLGYAQLATSDYKAMPAFPNDAKAAFKSSKTQMVDGNYAYLSCSDAITAYSNKIAADSKPYQDAVEARSKKTQAPAQGAANDFSDLNTPEMQAKIAKMSDAEKMQFAMDVQNRMKNNKNVEQISAINKPSPISAYTQKVNTSALALLGTLTPYNRSAYLDYNKCNNLCPDGDAGCAEKTKACENKVAHELYTAEVLRYNNHMKAVLAQYNTKKTAFENDLKEFDAQAAKYPKDDVAVDYLAVLSSLGSMADAIKKYEHEGANLVVEAKNNVYCKNDF